MGKFTIADYDKALEEVRQKRKRPNLIQTLREAAKKRKLPKL